MADNVVLNRDEVLDDAAGQLALWELKNKYDRGVITDILRDAGVNQSGLSRATVFTNLKNKFGVWLRENYKVNDWGNQQAYDVRNMKPEKLRELYVNGFPAETVKKQIEFNSFLPLFEPGKFTDAQGNEQTSPNWYEMNGDQISQFADGLGYNLNTMKDRKAFYDKVREYGTSYEKAKAVSDYAKDNTGWVLANALFAPTAYKEQMKQALTDAPFDKDKIARLSALDATTNLAMMLGAYELPYAGALGATALAEFIRQGGSYASGNGFDLAAPINATVTQGTVPGVVKMATSLATRNATSPVIKEFSRNFRAGVGGAEDALEIEKKNIVNALLKGRKEAANRPALHTYGSQSSIGSVSEHPQVRGENERIESLRSMLEALRYGKSTLPPKGQTTVELRTNEPGGLHDYTIGQMMGTPEPGLPEISDEVAVNSIVNALKMPETFTYIRPSGLMKEVYENNRNMARLLKALGSDEVQDADLVDAIANADKLQAAQKSWFPNTYDYHTGNYKPLDVTSKAYKAGKVLGPGLGSAEASTGIPLQTLLSGAYNKYILKQPSGVTKDKENAYTAQDWYRNLAKTRQGKALLEQLKKELEKRDAPEGEQ